MRQEPKDPNPLASWEEFDQLEGDDLKAAQELVQLRATIRRAELRRDELLSTVLSPDMYGEKPFSYRLAALLSGVSHETLRRRFGS